jgi:hypothetical protein
MKAWVLRRDVPYRESLPSLILAKTAEVIGQGLLLAIGFVLAAMTGAVGPRVLSAMGYLLLVEVAAVGGFVGVQVAGVLRRAGRLLAWAGSRP